jgi:serine/threonine-protein kinase
MTTSAMAAPLVGGRYRLQHILSSTFMAEVWLASDAELDRKVVVKLLASGAERERFTREARAVAALSHPNIVHLFDFGDERDRPYMVFEYLAGGSLEERLQRGERLSNEEIANVAHAIAEGLAHAHERGVVHRDLKPGNVLFDRDGRSKIADFGIAHVQDRDTLTETGTILGTAAYISPEQVKGEPATPASDVYSFGVMLYRLLAGRLPFEAATPTKLAALHRDAEPPPLPAGQDDVRPLAALVMAALAKEPSRRPADGAALIGALDEQSVLEAGTTAILQPPAPLGTPRRRAPVIAGLSVVAGLGAAGVLAAILLNSGPASAPAVPVRSSETGTAANPPTETSTANRPPTTSTASTRTQQTSIARPTTGRTAPTTTSPGPSTTTDVTTAPPASTTDVTTTVP